MYTKITEKKPKEGDKVWAAVDSKPINPKPAIFENGKFWDASDSEIEIFPTYWMYPDVPFMF